MNKIVEGLKEAVDYVRGRPKEGTKQAYRDDSRGEWIVEEFRDGVWRIIETRPLSP